MQKLKNIIKKIRDAFVFIHTLILILVFNIVNKKLSCIMITNGMGYGGAPFVLLEAARIYKKNGYKVIIFTEFYGELIKICKNQNIEVWIAPKGNRLLKKLALKSKFTFAFVNTIVMYKWIQVFNSMKIPTIWWLHESDTYIDMLRDKLPQTVPENIHVLTVSQRTVLALKKNNIAYETHMLYYGLEKLTFAKKNNIHVSNEYKFLVIGAISKRKNQIFSIKAFECLPDKIKKNSKIIFVGTPLSEDDEYYVEFLSKIKEHSRIEYIPKVQRNQISQLYSNINALICCSIDDPLPVVVTECLMFGKTVIVSSGAGQYSLIVDGYNGYLYKTNELEELCEKMIKAYKNRDNISMKKNAIDTYMTNFTNEIFEHKLMLYTKDTIKLNSVKFTQNH